MRHRIGGLENVYMGLGADNIPYELDNTWSGHKELDTVADKMLDDAVETLFAEIGGFDYKVTCNVEIEYDKNISDADCDKAFVEFVNKWHPQLLEAMKC